MRAVYFTALLSCCVLFGCSERAANEPRQESVATPTATSPAPGSNREQHSKFNIGGIPGTYSAQFDGKKLTRIVEERQPPGGEALHGEYSFEGARLLRYQGAKLATPTSIELDLQFDMQGVLLSGRGPDVTDEDITAIRTRAQTLRSHALAQRDAH